MVKIEILDIVQERCPISVAKTKKALQNLDPGVLLQVVTQDRHFKIDLDVLLHRVGGVIANTWQEGHNLYYLVQKGKV